ncbi:hypothetical protein ES705_47730 [subsurface metagenome]
MNIYKARIEIGSFKDGHARLFIEFADTKGQQQGDLQWTPAWDDVSELMVTAVEVERQNKPGSIYLEKFADVCSRVVTKYAPASHVQIMGGKCVEYWSDNTKSKAFLRVLYREITDRPGWIVGEEVWELSIPISEERLKNLINKDVQWVVWDGKVVEIRD